MKNQQTLVMAIATICCITCIALSRASAADSVPIVRHGNCHHVIDQVARYGVNNSVNVLNARGVMNGPAPLIFGGTANAAVIGDLEILHVGVAPAVRSGSGPHFLVVVKNNSCREVCGMQLSAVALLGTIHPTSPTTMIRVPSIAAGEAIELSVVLPADALTMGNYNRSVVGFDRLLVAIDSSDEFAEADEANNLKLFELSALHTAAQPPEPATAVAPQPNVERQSRPVNPSEQSAAIEPRRPTAPLGPPRAIDGNDLRTAMQRMTESQ